MKRAAWRLFSVLLCSAAILTSAGCGRDESDSETQQTSLGVDNEIAGFLLNFDQRDETDQMVKDKAKRIFPVKVDWAFDENLDVGEEADEYSSSDPDFGKDVFYALSNTIIMANAENHSEETPFYIELTLQDGQKVRYEFVSMSTIRLSAQNYVIESDGNLWSLIRKATKETEPTKRNKKIKKDEDPDKKEDASEEEDEDFEEAEEEELQETGDDSGSDEEKLRDAGDEQSSEDVTEKEETQETERLREQLRS